MPAAFFYSNWFSTFDTSRVADLAKQAYDVWWPFIDALFMLVVGTTGCHLWRDTSKPGV